MTYVFFSTHSSRSRISLSPLCFSLSYLSPPYCLTYVSPCPSTDTFYDWGHCLSFFFSLYVLILLLTLFIACLSPPFPVSIFDLSAFLAPFFFLSVPTLVFYASPHVHTPPSSHWIFHHVPSCYIRRMGWSLVDVKSLYLIRCCCGASLILPRE